MSATEVVNTYLTALQSGDMELAANTMSDDFIMNGFAPKELNKNQFLATFSNLLASMPDLSFNMSDELSEENNLVQVEIEITGTHTNELAMPVLGIAPIEPTGLSVILAQTKTSFHVNAENQVSRMAMQPIVGGGIEGLLQQVGAELPLAHRGVEFRD